jgi:hypothetical protein
VGTATSEKRGDLQRTFSLKSLENQPDAAYIRKQLMNVKDLDIPGAVGSHVGVIGVCCNHRELISIPTAVVIW